MRRLFVLLACLPLTVWTAAAAPGSLPLTGDWLTEGGDGVIRVETCTEGLCGRIVGIKRDPGEPMPRDVNGAPQCGLTILTIDPTPEDGVWHGNVTDPRNGTAYHAEVRMDSQGNLLMRGYILIPLLGETQTWQPFIGRFGPECQFVAGDGRSDAPPLPSG